MNRFKSFIFSVILGGILWIATGIFLMFLGNGFFYAVFSGFVVAISFAVLALLTFVKNSFWMKRFFKYFFAFLIPLFLVISAINFLKITSGEVALTAVFFAVITGILFSSEIGLRA